MTLTWKIFVTLDHVTGLAEEEPARETKRKTEMKRKRENNSHPFPYSFADYIMAVYYSLLQVSSSNDINDTGDCSWASNEKDIVSVEATTFFNTIN